jgi:drug/metabolite transporter (DMT)-like permease
MIDLLLVVMSVIWGTNYSIVKFAFHELDPQAFNAARMTIVSVVFLLVIGFLRFGRRTSAEQSSPDSFASIFRTPTRLTARDAAELAGLGLVGHFLYQYFFIGGLALTTVANSSLMLASTPVVIAVISAIFGQERVGARHWLGAALSLAGIYIVVGRGVEFGGRGLTGDLMMVAAVICWAVYTLGSRRLVSRHSPVGVTGLSMAIGTIVYVPVMWGHVQTAPWAGVSWQTWLSILYSSIFALGVAYTIWYAGVRQIGSARTSVYSNLIPIVAMATAVIFLGEPVLLRNVIGAAAVLGGVALTRATVRAQPVEPCEP